MVKMKFKPAGSNGILFLVGNPDDGDYVCVELQNQYLVYRYLCICVVPVQNFISISIFCELIGIALQQ